MNQYVIYKQESGNLALLIPSPRCLKERTIYEIAVKDVPQGKPFAIVNASDLPTELEHQEAWLIDDNNLTDGVGGESNEFN